MSCKRYQQLLHLNRTGEISEADAENLRVHLARCQQCSHEWRRLQRADELLRPMKSFTPPPPDPEKLTADIMRRVRGTTETESSPGVVNRILDLFLIPGIRYSAAAFITAVTLAFTFQSLTLLNQISALEQRMSSWTSRDREAAYTSHSETLREVVQSEKIHSPTAGMSFDPVNGRLRVPANDVDAFLSPANLQRLSSIIGSSALQVDHKTIEKIVGEIKATVKLSFRAG